ncbi:MAG: hypothetical protein ACR2L2_20470 [Acidobacteriota bacterium]
MPLEPGPYLSAFRILSDDFRRLREYVEPADQNLGTYSHRLYELLLRACAEFESACKELLVSGGATKKPGEMSITDYKTLESSLHLEALEVGILFWQPKPSYVKPFDGWSTAKPPLSWYTDYNEVKHNRNTEFARANLNNVRHAIAGQFALLAIVGVIHGVAGYQERPAKGGAATECVYPGYTFSLLK